MEDIVAIKATDASGKPHFFVTWGRVFDRTDPNSLLNAVRRALPQFGVSEPRQVELCSTLQEAAGQPYFYEALVSFTRQPAIDSAHRAEWESSCRERINSGKDIYYLGKPVT
jgi:hypothetical protein